ncbi:Na+/H+ antiporter [Pollutibacter soli]|uniref:Na+/H+ antiporter n=1 Tax=Pollutibacter soli TaxID=3034157 RepID=UPI003013D374
MLHHFPIFLALLFVILLLVMIARKLNIAYPILLVTGGLIIGFIPGMPTVNIPPELIFTIFLPPLLYDAAWHTSWKEFWRWRRVITSFAFLMVFFTAIVVALVSVAFIPGFTLALGFLLGGIVSPPDAVSATAILKQVNIPKRFISILEGESLVNDASGLIIFRFALIAVSTGTFVFSQAATNFFLVIAGGILIGLAIAVIFFWLHKVLPTDANTDIIFTLITPYVMYLVAEQLHVSGVLSVVSGGLFLSVRSHLFLSQHSRLSGTTVWSALGFVLNGLVFMLIGLELPVIVNDLGNASITQAIGYGVLITVAVTIVRILCSLGASYFTVFISRYITVADNRPGWRGPIIAGWAGMRGVVSLAAALSVPVYASDGVLFPQRSLILFITFIVILLTLLVQGLTLPWLIRIIKVDDRDHFLPVEEQDRKIRKNIARESLEYLHVHHAHAIENNAPLKTLGARWQYEYSMPDNTEEQMDYKKIYINLIEKQRNWLREMNRDISLDEDVIREHLMMLDIEEEKLRLRYPER